jgi:hypothetical protein
MRVSPIPDAEVWDGAQRRIIGPPDGDPTGDIRAVEVVVDIPPSLGVPVASARCVLEPGDLEKLAAGGTVWVSFYGGQIVPFSVDVAAPPHLRA